MKKTILFFCAFAAVAFAQETKRPNLPSDTLTATSSMSGTRVSNWTDDFESYAVGSPFTPNNGWTSNYYSNTEIIASGITGQSVRHNSDGFSYGGMELISPLFDADFQMLNFDVSIDAATGIYQIATVDSASNYYNTRLQFELDGSITALQTSDCYYGTFALTSGTWVPGTVYTFGIAVTDDGVLNIYQDGVLIFSGDDISAFCGSGSQTGMDYFQVYASNTANNTMTLDNISLSSSLAAIPTMGEWGLVLLIAALGVIAVIRMRKA